MILWGRLGNCLEEFSVRIIGGEVGESRGEGGVVTHAEPDVVDGFRVVEFVTLLFLQDVYLFFDFLLWNQSVICFNLNEEGISRNTQT